MDGIRSAQLGSQVVPLPVGLFFACLTKNANPKDPKKKKNQKKKYQFTKGGGQKERCVKETRRSSSTDSRQGEIIENPEPETGIITPRLHCGNKG